MYLTSRDERELKESFKHCLVINLNGMNYFVHPLCDGVGNINHWQLMQAAHLIIKDMINKDLDFNKLLTVEAMGIPVTTAISIETRRPFVIARKRKYGLPSEIEISQDKGYEKNNLYLNGIYKNERVVIVDDVCSTGNTLTGLIDAVQYQGATVCACYTIVDINGSINQFPHSKALVSIDIDDQGKVVVY